jgi:hypothetical protein
MKRLKYFRFKKIAARIFELTQHAVDICIEDASDPDIHGGLFKIEINIAPPLFWRRRNCQHARAKKTGLVTNGKTYCLCCEQLIDIRS